MIETNYGPIVYTQDCGEGAAVVTIAEALENGKSCTVFLQYEQVKSLREFLQEVEAGKDL